MRTTLLLLLSVAACDSQVDGDHNGTALAKLGGNVKNQRTTATDEAEVGIVWENTSGSPDFTVAETVPVVGTFPASFQLSIYEPPPPEVLNDYGDSKMGVAYILSVIPGSDLSNDSAPGILGMDPDHLLVYVPEDVQPGTTVATVLRGTPAAGFHVYAVKHLTDQEMADRQTCSDGLDPNASLQELFDTCGGFPLFDDFIVTPDDLATPLEVDLVDDIDQLDVPNWT